MPTDMLRRLTNRRFIIIIIIIIISERIVKIGQYLTKFCVEHLGFTFLVHPFWATIPQRHGQADGQTTCYGNTALCIAWRGKN